MTDYDSMSVHELVLEAAKDGMQGFLHDANPELCELPEIESALRRKVIEESSVGTLTCHAGMLGQTYGDKPITPFNEGDRYALVLLPKGGDNG